ncbi:uncharacterized protein CTRU02_206725 [Colletotrichum truncatum]|uniref:Uncharacterized protein n=1 Tax=Colletotrichum truncatum TaxID=5467 RepID=A0ACC3Z7S9_COLTU|nr:uncharacterized protein CTRU02_14147 [Colletotrichum truncatum]KAF6782500.1 hypothetical protein CTRU02_14147 [Colletotrichum truncatum]
MRFSVVILALSGSASALPAFNGVAARQPTDAVSRSTELTSTGSTSVVEDLSRRGFKAEVITNDAEGSGTKRSTLELETRQSKKGSTAANAGGGNPHANAIGDNKVNPTTGLTDSEAAEIVTGLDLKDKKAPGSLNSKGQRNPLPGLSADETDAIVKQGQAALKEAGA